jgi:acetate kinase
VAHLTDRRSAETVSERRVLVVNTGSATLKATVLDLPDIEPRFETTVDWHAEASDADRRATLQTVLLEGERAGIAPSTIDLVGHRVVHGGERFVEPVVIDEPILVELDGLAALAPLHDPVAVAAIRAARSRLADIPHVAAFDTAFHASLPEAARRYPVPDAWGERHGVRRYGFHGLSVAWSVGRAAALLDRPVGELRLLVAHLGGGCSVTAVDGGRSVDTSMGLTPLEGLMMATRAGSIDPGIVFHLLRGGRAADEIERDLDHRSGLLGVGGTADMREVLAAAEVGDERARIALELFARRAAAGIAAAATTLPSVDAIVFTGGIGEHATTVRRSICERLGIIGVPIVGDDDPNAADPVLARAPGGLAVLRVHAREDVEIARSAVAAVARLGS